MTLIVKRNLIRGINTFFATEKLFKTLILVVLNRFIEIDYLK